MLDTLNRAAISLLPKRVISTLGRPYLAGSSLEEGFQAVQENYTDCGRYSTFDILGEEATTKQEADHYLLSYIQAAHFFSSIFCGQSPHQRPVSLSVKPSSICAIVSAEPLQLDASTPLPERLEQLCGHAADLDVTLDMEDHRWTDVSLSAAEELLEKGYTNLGIVLQSRLNRTQQDIDYYLSRPSYPFPKEKIRVRACIGIYNEPEEIATNNIPEAKNRLVKRILELFAAGVYVEIATHDQEVIDRLLPLIDHYERSGIISPERYEFQFLRGVQAGEVLGEQLRQRGKIVREYMPIELAPGLGAAYVKRRLKANPRLVVLGSKNFFNKL
ncbi:proline dehydrogenase family protein [Candidatus Woesearchaeota archaeon]|nr:proline dehydrogenase family protein [Candidatus Woesearchaeota archaeon]